MSKQFIKGNVYVFTTKKFMKVDEPLGDKKGSWITRLNGNKITTIHNSHDAYIEGFAMKPTWCKCIKNNNPKIESEAI